MGSVSQLARSPGAKSLSNRKDFAALSAADDTSSAPAGPFGVDRLSVSFRVQPPDVGDLRGRGFSMHEGGPVDDPRRTLSLVDSGRDHGGAVFVGVALVPDKGWVGKVECNPSRLGDPDGYSLLPVGETAAAVDEMWGVVRRAGLVPMTPPAEGRVKRLDIARDFRGVGFPSFYVRGLQNIRRPHARSSYTYNNPQRNSAETLWVGSKTGGVRLYDQHEAYGSKGAPPGSLRWEVEARGGWLDRHGIVSVSDVGTGAALALAADRWDWSAMGTEVSGTANVVEAIERRVCRHPRSKGGGGRSCESFCDGLSRAKADRLLGQLVRESLGVSAPVSTHAAADYNRLKSALGVVPAADLFGALTQVPVAGRLDWSLGTEVAA